jgi:uncharacterized protein (TIGR00299 family) protein
MRVVYFEPFCGISGDMTLGALVDLGVDLELLRARLALLPVSGYRLTARRVSRSGIQATKVDVEIPASAAVGHHHHEHRTFTDIRAMIDSSALAPRVKGRAVAVFERLAIAEGRIHGVPPEQVHFHEVGAVDSIVDIVGSVVGLEELMPARVLAAPINLGRGTVQTSHGLLPVPGPATEELLRGIPTYSDRIDGELTTPTGATLLATLADGFGHRPAMRGERAGYGAGTREIAGVPNVLRVTVGEELEGAAGFAPEPRVAVITATIDDMSPQVYGHFQELALEAGALDVYASPIFMK